MAVTTFTIAAGAAAPSAAVELTSNYFDRMDSLKSGDDPTWAEEGWANLGLPDIYRFLVANARDFERAEQIFNWDNWVWLRVDTTGPGGTLTVEVTAYAVTITDDHLTGGDRITNFSYATTTNTYTYAVGDRGTTYVDLRVPEEYAEVGGTVSPDLRWVKTITLRFPESAVAQTWTVNLRLTGKKNAEPYVQLHFGIPKEADDWAQLWAAAVVDGKPCMRAPDDFTKRTQQGLPYYVNLTGRESGIDVGGPYNLDQAEDIINWQEGFAATYQETVANLMMYEGGDPEATQLFTVYAFDAREQRFLDGDTNIPCAMRCDSWTIAPLTLHTVYSEKHMRGGTWCWIKAGSTVKIDLDRESDDANLPVVSYKRATVNDDWELEGSADADVRGLITPPMVPGVLRTGLKRRGGRFEPLDVGIIPEREFYFYAFLGLANPHLRRDAAGRAWLVYEDGGDIAVAVRSSSREDWQGRGRVFVENDHAEPTIAPMPDGSLLVSATRGDSGTELRVSRDDGDEWVGVDVG